MHCCFGSFSFLFKHLSVFIKQSTGDAWQSSRPTYDSRYIRPGLAGSVQVVSSTNGELGPSADDANLVDRRTGVPLNSQPEVEMVDETKYVVYVFSNPFLPLYGKLFLKYLFHFLS